MTDLTTDDKIARLVHLVLEAVDHRLADIRVELQQIDGRLTRLELSPAQPAGQPARADDDRFDHLRGEIDSIRGLVESLAAHPAPAPAGNSPVLAVPLLPIAPSFQAAASAAPTQVAIPSTPPTDVSELIDLDRLSDLLSERLGQLDLQRPT